MKHNFDEFKVGNWYYEANLKRVLRCDYSEDNVISGFSYTLNENYFIGSRCMSDKSFYEIESPYAMFKSGDIVYNSETKKLHKFNPPTCKDEEFIKNGWSGIYIIKRKDQEKEKCPVCGSTEWKWQTPNGRYYSVSAVRSCCKSILSVKYGNSPISEAVDYLKEHDSIYKKSLDLSLYDDDYYTM